jgi:hypothetical protein
VFSFAASTEGLGSVSNQIIYEKRLGARNQVELSIPFGWQEAELPTMSPIARYHWIGGLGDISIGAKRALFHNGRSGTIFSVTGEFVLPAGDSAKGFGKGTPVFETFASFGQILPSQFFCQAQAGVELPKNTELAEREGFWRFSLGRTFSRGISGRSWSPMVEMLAARELISGEKVQWDAVPQMQVSLSRRQHILASFGVRLPLTESGPRAAQFLCYILWDWFDGGFFEGWR